METAHPQQPVEHPRSKYGAKLFLKTLIVLGIGFLLGYVHYATVKHLFEQDRNFSHLSDLEREMSLQTEMGLYYSYYKTLVEEEEFLYGVNKLFNDNTIEFPKKVNVFSRFNIHPEFLVALIYHYVWPYHNDTECHMVTRGDDLPAVFSCVGLGDKMYFYLESVWWLAGLTFTTLFFYATSLSGSIMAGLMACFQYLANHSECTRVMWTPNERENFAQPFLLMQMWLVTLRLRRPNAVALEPILIILNTICLLCWQFSQFILATQAAILFFMEQLYIIDLKTLIVFLYTHFGGLHMAIIILYGNNLLKTSFYICFFASIVVCCIPFSKLRLKIKNKKLLSMEVILLFLKVGILLMMTFYFKRLLTVLFDSDDDGHIFELFMAKFTSYKSFHTLLYTTSIVFGFLPLKYFTNVTSTGLLPTVVLAIINLILYWSINSMNRMDKNNAETVSKGTADEISKKIIEPVSTDNYDPTCNNISEEGRPILNKSTDDNTRTDEQISEITEEPVSDKTAEPVLDKTAESVLDKTDEPVIDKTTETVLDKTAEPLLHKTAESVLDKTAESVLDKTDEPVIDKTTETVLDKTAEPLLHKTAESVLHKTAESVLDKTTESELDKTAEPVLDKTAEAFLDKTTEPVLDKTAEPVLDKTTESELDKTAEPVLDKTDEPLLDKVAKPLLDKTDEPILDKTTESELDKTAELELDKTAELVLDKSTELVLDKTAEPVLDKTSESVLDKTADPSSSKTIEFLRNLNIDAGAFYNIAQMIVFGLMAILVMRLKLLFTPQLCIVSAIAFNKKYYCSLIIQHKNKLLMVSAPFILLFVWKGFQNYLDEISHVGDYTNIELETLINWIAEETSPLAVFAGPMPLMATVLLTTRRAVINHPHYENLDSRLRTYAVYKTYGKFPPKELYRDLSKYKVNYLIVEKRYCYGRSGNIQIFEHIWDTVMPTLKNHPRLCHSLLTERQENFYRVYNNRQYAVLKLHDFSVSYTPVTQQS